MKTLDKIREKLRGRPAVLEQERKNGKRVIGYFCCNVPEEIIHALGLIPIRLGRGGDDRLVEVGSRYLSAQNCAFVRESVGLFATGEDPYIQNTDCLVVAANCLQIYRLAEIVEYYFKAKALVIPVPRNFYQEQGVKYFEDVIADFAGGLEEFAGVKLDIQELDKSVALYQKIRQGIRDIYQLLTKPDPSVTWREVYELVQAGFFLDRSEYLTLITEFLAEAQQKQAGAIQTRKPRFLLSGSLIPTGDEKLLNIIDEVGGEVIVDDLCTGLRPFLSLNIAEISPAGIARAYLERVPCASLPRLDIGGDRRLENLTELIRDYQPDGVIYHTLRYCDPFTFKANETKNFLGAEIPFLEIHTEYATSDMEGIRTRVGAFVELIKNLNPAKEVTKIV
ncbi:MAG TPA: 2-hydroxyacyl-CoA dehydratase family protein [Methylomusa anaerophila]|uniref:Benzoyl-CoA reductase subunit C n=1 Tax=Methylomusa anaerophila TaxID=1930071 RepID=A0A348AG21_9FIRM|nr:2-hydroxyacyl-CoA dehydratase family protein [Methylomusa anaerophila]BBB90019.1 benzoyl-CoA reductase subunit C [Methylomusa anaerophila]HML88252.1 2-hydroxyacyl-CoA dehydratase family protein [Methylomusa anaerophila]